MSTLSLVAPEYRETAGVIPVFDYDTQPLAEIRAALLQAYGTKYGSPDLVEKEEMFFAGAEGDPQVRGLLYRPNGCEEIFLSRPKQRPEGIVRGRHASARLVSSGAQELSEYSRALIRHEDVSI